MEVAVLGKKGNVKIKLIKQLILGSIVPICIKRKTLSPTGMHDDFFLAFYGFY